jgi:subtilisin family serine protease
LKELLMRLSLWLCALGLALSASPLSADDADEFLLRPTPGALQRVVTRYRLQVLKSIPGKNLFLVKPIDDDDFDDHVIGDPDVIAVERNEELFAPEIPSGSTSPTTDPLQQGLATRRMVNYFGNMVWESFARQRASQVVGLPQTQARGRTGSGIVAVIDTGVDANHPVLWNALVDGYDFTRDRAGIPNDLNDVDNFTAAVLTQTTTAFIDNGARPVPINHYLVAALTQTTTAFIDTGKLPSGFGHGTMVASLVRLAAPTARIMPLKAFLADGRSNTFDIIRAVYYAADNGAQVINMSFNMKETSAELTRSINYAAGRRVTLVSSVGNDGNEIVVYPAAYPRVIGVASTTMASLRSPFSNYGTQTVSLAAPGEGVVVAYPGNNYATAWGTSFSAPLVAGAAALFLQMNPLASPAEIENMLLRTARRLEPVLGAGGLNVSTW